MLLTSTYTNTYMLLTPLTIHIPAIVYGLGAAGVFLLVAVGGGKLLGRSRKRREAEWQRTVRRQYADSDDDYPKAL